MFAHILIPTDGSPLSERAIAQGIRLAKATGARVTGLYVMARHLRYSALMRSSAPFGQSCPYLSTYFFCA